MKRIISITVIAVVAAILILRGVDSTKQTKLNFQWDNENVEMSKAIKQVLAHEDAFINIYNFAINNETVRDPENIGSYMSDDDNYLDFDISQIKKDMDLIIIKSDFDEIYFSPDTISFEFNSEISDLLISIEYTYDDYYYEEGDGYERIAPHWYYRAWVGD